MRPPRKPSGQRRGPASGKTTGFGVRPGPAPTETPSRPARSGPQRGPPASRFIDSDDRGAREIRALRAARPARDARPAGEDRPTRDQDRRPPRPPRGNVAPAGRSTRAGKPGPAAPEAPRIKRAPPLERVTEVAPQRIAKALARAGVASRRDIERMIAEGRIEIDGTKLTSPALNITSLRGVTVDGQPVAGIAPARLYRFHKPAGFLTAARDPAGRPTIMDILPPDLPRVVPVGRLDMNTEGLLLLTTDGELKRALELPSSSIPRVYRVRAFGEVTQAALESLADGATIDGIHYGPVLADIERKTGHNLWLIVTIREGKNREVRRVLEHIGLQVNRLIRVAYGPIGLDDLPPRGADEIPQSDVQALMAMLKPLKPQKK
ncbi:pseudouridine synthase [Sandarakinorhabdus sp.]|uniref:pseudouridine synthase n=1 Tax=Sandarakinorhabdus sp. TaxID=1916663 RepID=UPI003F6F860F